MTQEDPREPTQYQTTEQAFFRAESERLEEGARLLDDSLDYSEHLSPEERMMHQVSRPYIAKGKSEELRATKREVKDVVEKEALPASMPLSALAEEAYRTGRLNPGSFLNSVLPEDATAQRGGNYGIPN